MWLNVIPKVIIIGQWTRHSSSKIWLGRRTSKSGSREKIQANVWKIRKINLMSLLSKLHPSNLMNTIWYFNVLIQKCVKLNFAALHGSRV